MRTDEWSFGGAVLRVCGAIIALAVLWVLIASGVFGLRVGLAEYIGRGEAQIEIQSGVSRIANYNKFFNDCASIQALESSIDAQDTALQTANDANDISRINQNIAGLQGTRARAIYQYNANAMKDYTSGQFRDSDLPYQIEASEYAPHTEKTRCAS